MSTTVACAVEGEYKNIVYPSGPVGPWKKTRVDPTSENNVLMLSRHLRSNIKKTVKTISGYLKIRNED
jgi:hypothetical protein